MRVAYLTLDEVNRHLAQSFADEHGVSLDILACAGAIAEGEHDAVLYDPDSFPEEECRANLTAVLACPFDTTIAVHAYDFSTDRLRDVRRPGIILARRLGAEMFTRLVTAVQATRRQQTVA